VGVNPRILKRKRHAALQKALIEMIQVGLVDSAHDCSEGGVAVALAESSFPQGVGLKVELTAQGIPAECVLFGEDASRVVISCDRSNLLGIQQVAVKYGLSLDAIGETVGERVEIRIDGQLVVSAPVVDLHESYESALEAALKSEPTAVAAD
jgi:phosphoribosylformylglycinamidine (FGAM) synthase-like enzyme